MGCALDTGTPHDVVLIPIAGGKSGGSLPKDLTDFQPSENQKSILEAFHEGKYVVSVSDACKAVGISRNAYYLWFQDEGFCQWWNKESDRWAAMQRCRIVGAIVGAATSGDASRDTKGSTADRKLFLERYDAGYMPKSRKELEHHGSVPIDLSQMSQEELERMAHAAGVKDEEPQQTIPNKPTTSPMPRPEGIECPYCHVADGEVIKTAWVGGQLICKACKAPVGVPDGH